MRRGQYQQRGIFFIAGRLDPAAQFDLGAGALGEVDDPGIAGRRLRQRMTAAVIAAAHLRSQRDQRPERDEGDQPDRDDPGNEPRIEAMIIGCGVAHARAQFFGTVSSA